MKHFHQLTQEINLFLSSKQSQALVYFIVFFFYYKHIAKTQFVVICISTL